MCPIDNVTLKMTRKQPPLLNCVINKKKKKKKSKSEIQYINYYYSYEAF